MPEQEKDDELNTKAILDEKAITTFDSAFYFDDIIKELSEAGFYDDEQNNTAEEQPFENSGKSSSTQSKEQQHTPNATASELSDLENNLATNFNQVNLKIKTLKDLIIRQKTETALNQKELLEKIMLLKHEGDEGFNNIQSSLAQKNMMDDTKDKAFEKLYEQMEGYKKNFIKATMRPFISDLILLYDRLQNNLTSAEALNNPQMVAVMQMFRDELLEILARNNIVPMLKSEIGEKFNAEKSNAVKKIETDDQSKDLTVCQVLQEGFIVDDKNFRSELVSIYKFKTVEG